MKHIEFLLSLSLLSIPLCGFSNDGSQTSPVPNGNSSPEISVDKNIEKSIPTKELEPVETTAMRFSDSIFETAVMGITISSQEISDSDLISVSQVINRYTDVYMRDMGGGIFMGQPSMRGFGSNSQTRVLVLLDGQRLNNIDISGINWGQIQIQDVDNIEVLYGSQTATYGNYAESGVIKISTKKWGKNGGTVGGTYGEYGEYSFYGTLNYSTDDYYVSVGANYFHDSGFFDNSLNWNKSATLNAGLKLDTKNELGLYINFGNMFISWPGYIYASSVNDMQNIYPNGLNHNEEDYVQYFTSSMSWENKTLEGEGSAHLGMNARNKSIDWIGSRTADSTLWTVSFDPKYRYYFGDEGMSFAEAGVDFYYDNFDAHAPAAGWSDKYDTQVERFTVSPWIGGKAQLDEIFSLSASGRYEAAINDANTSSSYYNLDDNELVNGFAAQFSSNAQLSKTWNVYARFDQIYHYPSIDERYSLYGGGATYTNNNLDPEHGQNYEIGTNFSKDGFTLGGSLFYMHLNNEIAYDGINYVNKNIGDTDRLGAQFRIAYDYQKLAGIFTSWQFVSAEYASGIYKDETVAMVPPVTSKSGIWVSPIKYTKVELNFLWASRQYQEGYLDPYGSNIKIPESYSLDLTVNVYPCDNAKLFFGVSNLTDHINCSYATYNCWYVMPGRTIRCGLEIKF